MIKDVHINNPKRSLLRGSNSDTDSAHSRRAPRLRGVLEAVAAGKVREIAFSPKLAIASLIIYHLCRQAGNKFGSFAPDSDHPLTGLLPRNAPSGISRR